MRNFYAERQKVLRTAINEHLNEYLEVEKDVAGMHLVAWLKNDLNDREIAEKALKFGVYTPPMSFYCTHEKLRDGLLLGYTGISPTEILTGVKRLREMFETIAKK
jgi:GntR family transcriptional regulator/MocR family aminotransferase